MCLNSACLITVVVKINVSDNADFIKYAAYLQLKEKKQKNLKAISLTGAITNLVAALSKSPRFFVISTIFQTKDSRFRDNN